MFNQHNFDKLIDWINNHNSFLQEIISTDSNNLKDNKKILLKAILDSDNIYIDTNSDFSICVYKIIGRQTESLKFIFSDFLNLKSLEEKAYYLISRKDTLSESDQTALIDGLFMYAVQEQDIPIASLLYLNIKDNDKFKDDYLEFLNFEQNTDGSIGIINPLKGSFASSEQVKEWILYNSFFVYATLPLTTDFKRR